MDYYSIDDIFSDETKIKVSFKHKIEHFGFLLSRNKKEIEEDRKVDMPLYLVKFLIENKHCVIRSPIISKELVNDLRANSRIVNLRNSYDNFYNFLAYFCDSDYVIEIFFQRLSSFSKFIMKENIEEDDIFFMDQLEKKIITESRKAYQEYKKYFIKEI